MGHIARSGALAGPKVLEHVVDAVLCFEGGVHEGYRLLRPRKNRSVDNPSALLLAQSSPGTAVAGEVGLAGEVRPVAGLEPRVREAGRMGLGRCVVPAWGTGRLGEAERGLVVGVRRIGEAMDAALAPRGAPRPHTGEVVGGHEGARPGGTVG